MAPQELRFGDEPLNRQNGSALSLTDLQKHKHPITHIRRFIYIHTHTIEAIQKHKHHITYIMRCLYILVTTAVATGHNFAPQHLCDHLVF
jgi:hypothetical protein